MTEVPESQDPMDLVAAVRADNYPEALATALRQVLVDMVHEETWRVYRVAEVQIARLAANAVGASMVAKDPIRLRPLLEFWVRQSLVCESEWSVPPALPLGAGRD